jgi:dynein heavy chain
LSVLYTCYLPQLPVITDLRNPTLKQRHWDVISEILEYEFSDEEPLTLGKLSEINAFKSGEQLQEVSGQASSEASLEAILKKVEDSWKSTELMGQVFRFVQVKLTKISYIGILL